MYLLGYDIGSSSIKAALVDAASGKALAVVQYPEMEMKIIAEQTGWAEQAPETWWENVCVATQKLLHQTGISSNNIQSIGISYQMHGLVLVDKNQKVLRPSIIWCDSRAVEVGNEAFEAIGQEKSLKHHLNSPGNFTASKLKWVKENEPDIYAQMDKMMLPGDYIAMKLTGETCTTISGLSEGILWDFKENEVAKLVLEEYGLDEKMIPEIRPTFSIQGKMTPAAATATGLVQGIPVTYRAGDQPNNALSLNVLKTGEVAATGGTSGVVYGVVDKPVYDLQSRVNGFAHVNYTKEKTQIGILLCINGAGIQYAWMRQHAAKSNISYPEMEELATIIPIGSDGLSILPFGNGAERMLNNANIGSHICNLQLNQHGQAHLYRAALEGIAFSFVYGIEILKEMGLDLSIMRVGNDNLFQSSIFAHTIATLVDSQIDVVETTGAVGAAKASGVASGVYASLEEALKEVTVLRSYLPQKNDREAYRVAYVRWKGCLEKVM
ncbi:MAG: FGGY family carbohydrate kinase [Chitinophagales bacterium]